MMFLKKKNMVLLFDNTGYYGKGYIGIKKCGSLEGFENLIRRIWRVKVSEKRISIYVY